MMERSKNTNNNEWQKYDEGRRMKAEEKGEDGKEMEETTPDMKKWVNRKRR